LEEVSGFVVVTKQNFFRPIRKKQQNQQRQQQNSPEKEIYFVANQKHTDRYNLHDTQEEKYDEETELSGHKSDQNSSKLSDTKTIQTRNGSTSKCTGTCNEGRIQLRHACDEKENKLFPVDDADFERHHAEGMRPKVPLSKSRVTQIIRHRNSAEERRDDSYKMQTIAEGCVQEQSQVPSGQCRSNVDGHTRQRALDTTTDVKTLDKIEAIEGWIKIYESEFFTERNKEMRNKIPRTPVNEVMQHNTTVAIQETCNLATLPGSGPAEIKTSTDYVHNYVEATGPLTQNECARIPECSGSHPRIETANKSASIKRSQQDLESLKYTSAESLEEMQFNQKNCGSKCKETSLPKVSIETHQINDQTMNHERSQEHFCNPITNMNTESNILKNISSTSVNDSQHLKCSSQKNNVYEGEISIEPICKAVRVVHQEHEQSNSFQFMARSEFKKHTTRTGNIATLEEIEAMIEPDLKEPSSTKQTSKERKSDRTGAKSEPSRTNIQSLIPDIVQVKLGIENQSKILDKLDLMMKHSELVERGTYKTKDAQTVLVPCSENLVSEHLTSIGTGNTELTSCRQFNFPSNIFHSKPAADCESSGISEMNKPHGQCNVSSEWSNVSVCTQMMREGITEHRHRLSPQCRSLQNFPVGQNQAFGPGTLKGHPTGEYHSFNKPVSIICNSFLVQYCRRTKQMPCS
jgi:hypothetical protein